MKKKYVCACVFILLSIIAHLYFPKLAPFHMPVFQLYVCLKEMSLLVLDSFLKWVGFAVSRFIAIEL